MAADQRTRAASSARNTGRVQRNRRAYLSADIACRDNRGAVTVGNEAPVWQDRCPGQSLHSRLALAEARQHYDDAIGDYPV